jgi:hypothetical protein
VNPSANGKTLQLDVPHQIRGLTLELPIGWRFSSSTPSSLKITQRGNRLQLARAEGRIKITFETVTGHIAVSK